MTSSFFAACERRTLRVATWIAAMVLCSLSPGVAASECPEEAESLAIWVAQGYSAAQFGGDDDGIGGSGYSDDVRDVGDDDGIGGSGLFGTVTGFGSICINGRRIQYDDEVPVSYGGNTATSDDLEIGQVVAVVARDEQALAIDVVFAVVGPVETVAASSFTVMGQGVELAKGAIIEGNALAVGGRVAVSGLRRPDGTIVASRVDPANATLSDSVADLGINALFGSEVDRIDIEGYVYAVGTDGLSLGYMQIDSKVFKNTGAAALPEVGTRVRVRASRSQLGGFDGVRVERVREVKLMRDFRRLDRERPQHPRHKAPRGPDSIRPQRPDRVDMPIRPNYRHPNDRARVRGHGRR